MLARENSRAAAFWFTPAREVPQHHDAKIMDTSAPKFLKAMLMVVLPVALAGCSLLQGSGTTNSGSASAARAPQQSAAGAGGAEPVAKPTTPSAQPGIAPPITSTATSSKPAPATASRGAEKLVAPMVPKGTGAKPPVVARTAAAPPSKTSIPAAQNDPATGVETVAGTAPKELVFKGPPRQASQSQPTERSQVLWLGICLVGVGCAVAGWIYLQLRLQSAAADKTGKDELMTPPGFILKEPKNLPPPSA